MVKLKIKVTKEILERSKFCKENAGKTCAIALAVREIFPAAWVNENNIAVYGSDEALEGFIGHPICYVQLPGEASKFIKEFDSTYPVGRSKMDEIEFEVEVPDKFLNTINIDEVKQILKTSKTLELKEV